MAAARNMTEVTYVSGQGSAPPCERIGTIGASLRNLGTFPAEADILMTVTIEPRSGAAFKLAKGQFLEVRDPLGQQVSDLLAFNADDTAEVISNGRTFDYADTIYLTTGHVLYSNRSNGLLEIVRDDVGTHDFLLTPCSRDTFRLLYDDLEPHRGCFGNLAGALAPFGIVEDQIPCAFNCFMNVPVDGKTGTFTVEAPLSKAGDTIVFKAMMDVIIGLTACSAPKSNNGSFKPIEYAIHDQMDGIS